MTSRTSPIRVDRKRLTCSLENFVLPRRVGGDVGKVSGTSNPSFGIWDFDIVLPLVVAASTGLFLNIVDEEWWDIYGHVNPSLILTWMLVFESAKPSAVC